MAKKKQMLELPGHADEVQPTHPTDRPTATNDLFALGRFSQSIGALMANALLLEAEIACSSCEC